ncbi:rCG61392 [Rattus norvegicus]|uniref:RCG61392 n=1 Tax=Rattus norvegicus TaxID=10116 RepID=A6HBG7_RAT|nr:rCG61392 [Rattus norvegicus]
MSTHTGRSWDLRGQREESHRRKSVIILISITPPMTPWNFRPETHFHCYHDRSSIA